MEKVKIMVVDDNKEFCNLIKECIRMRDNVEFSGAAFDGISALQLMREINPDIILLDIIMPNMDGFKVLKHLRNYEPDKRPKVVVMSVAPTKECTKRIYELGASYVIQSKIDIDEIIDRCIMVAKSKENACLM